MQFILNELCLEWRGSYLTVVEIKPIVSPCELHHMTDFLSYKESFEGKFASNVMEKSPFVHALT